MNRKTIGRRAGFSMLEAIFAAAIFVGAVALISQLLDLGLSSVRSAKIAALGELKLQTKLEEILLGLEPFSSLPTDPTPFPEDETWRWRAEILPTEVASLVTLNLVVDYLPENAEEPVAEFRVARWICPLEEKSLADEGAKSPITIREILGLSAPAGPVSP